jgi:hypothetical protein
MQNKIKEIFDEIQKSNPMNVFKTLETWPNLARGYLFQVEFINSQTGYKYDDLMLKVRKVDFHENDNDFDITFDEFEDFKTWKQLNEFVRNRTWLDINIKFYDSQLKNVLYTHSKKECVCKHVFPLNVDVTSDKKLEIKAKF